MRVQRRIEPREWEVAICPVPSKLKVKFFTFPEAEDSVRPVVNRAKESRENQEWLSGGLERLVVVV